MRTTRSAIPTQADVGDVRRAWLSVLLLVPAFLGAFLAAFLGVYLVGEVLLPLLGQSAEAGRLPPWGEVLAMTPAYVVFALPAVVSSWFAARAQRESGAKDGWFPAAFLITAAVLFVVLDTAL